jgi:hypothetical protein
MAMDTCITRALRVALHTCSAAQALPVRLAPVCAARVRLCAPRTCACVRRAPPGHPLPSATPLCHPSTLRHSLSPPPPPPQLALKGRPPARVEDILTVPAAPAGSPAPADAAAIRKELDSCAQVRERGSGGGQEYVERGWTGGAGMERGYAETEGIRGEGQQCRRVRAEGGGDDDSGTATRHALRDSETAQTAGRNATDVEKDGACRDSDGAGGLRPGRV